MGTGSSQQGHGQQHITTKTAQPTPTPSRQDRQTTDLPLTETGRPVPQQARAQREARHQEMFSSLSPQEKADLLALLEKVNAHWDRQYRTSDPDRRDS